MREETLVVFFGVPVFQYSPSYINTSFIGVPEVF